MLPNSTTTVGGEAPPPSTPSPTPTPPLPAASDCTVPSPSSPPSDSPLDSFSKDGRKICVGDCALFKAPQDSPPFIGIIRKVTVDKEGKYSLGVSWLYRPADVKLAKGALLEAAPNEVFYSFHKDDIPAASLLHPCRVAFLRKSIKLPSGISSFVCRRVYDIENNCLWWLTDKDYINERQEEVDKLLNKTRLEMHGVLPSGGQSPKSSNGPTSAHQLKPSSDSVNSASFPSQVKGKKRELSDQSTDSSRRRRLSKTEDGDSGLLRSEHLLNSEIAKITEKGELVDFEGVEKLVQLMQSDNNNKTIDLAARTMLVDVIAVTDGLDCLAHFIQSGGLSVLDEWLQGFHKGKISDGGSTKENDKLVTEFLLAVLRALDKLPVNLHALQTCNVGKSVNHLRTHKNFEIQKKSRSLVDTWKKRVEAEMNMNEAKSTSNRAKNAVTSGEDGRSSATGPAAPSKSSTGVLRHQKSGNSLHGSAVSGVQKEPLPGKVSSSPKISPSERGSPTSVSNNKVPESPGDRGSNQRLIVRLPNTARSPSSGANSGSFADEPAIGSGRSSPIDKHDNHDGRENGRTEAIPSNSASSIKPDLCQGNDELAGSGDGNLSRDDESHRDSETGDRTVTLKPSGSSPGVIPGKGKPYDTSLTSINALVESCVKISEASASASPEDDAGMNLLASVATGEILKSDSVSPSASPQIHSIAAGESCLVNDLKAKNELRCSAVAEPESFADDSKSTPVGSDQQMGDEDAALPSSTFSQHASSVPSLKSNLTPEEPICDASVAKSLIVKNENPIEVDHVNQSTEKVGPDSNLKMHAQIDECDQLVLGSGRTIECGMSAVSEVAALSVKLEKEVSQASACSPLEPGKSVLNETAKMSSGGVLAEKESAATEVPQSSLARRSENANLPSAFADRMDADPKVGRSNVSSVSVVSSALDNHSERTKSADIKDDKGLLAVTFSTEETELHQMPSEAQLDGAESEGLKQRQDLATDVSKCAPGSGTALKLEFDLNEGFPADDGNQGELAKSVVPAVSSAVHLPFPLPIPVSSMSGTFSTSITVAAAAKGPFVPPENLSWSKSALGWKGSAATSAFRPAEPRKNLDVPLNSSSEIPHTDTGASKQGRPLFDFDLNVADERGLEDVTAPTYSESGSRDHGAGLDLDLNRVHEVSDAGPDLVSYGSRVDLPSISTRLPLPPGFSNGLPNLAKGFDLNNGPGLDEAGNETTSTGQAIKSTLPLASSLPSARMNGAEFSNILSWFPPANSYPAITLSSIFPGRGEQSYVAAPGPPRMLAPPSTSNSFGPEMYRGQVLSSSPAPPFPMPTPFQYSGFAFETGVPLSSNSNHSGTSTAYVDPSPGGAVFFPAIPPQLVGPASVVPSPYPRPSFLMSIPGGPSSTNSDGRKWGGQLDLNTGPAGVEAETRDEKLRLGMQQHLFSGSQAMTGMTEEQLKMYHMAAGVGSSSNLFKRKEPDGGRDANDRFGHPHASWK